MGKQSVQGSSYLCKELFQGWKEAHVVHLDDVVDDDPAIDLTNIVNLGALSESYHSLTRTKSGKVML